MNIPPAALEVKNDAEQKQNKKQQQSHMAWVVIGADARLFNVSVQDLSSTRNHIYKS